MFYELVSFDAHGYPNESVFFRQIDTAKRYAENLVKSPLEWAQSRYDDNAIVAEAVDFTYNDLEIFRRDFEIA